MGSCESINPHSDVIQPINFQGIQFICKSWKKTYSNLFDYTANPDLLSNHLIKITATTTLVKADGKFQLFPYPHNHLISQPSKDIQAVIDLIQTKNHINETPIKKNQENRLRNQNLFTLSHNVEKSKQQLWIVIKSLPSKRYKLKEGDLLKIGKQKIRVKEIINRIGLEEIEEDEDIKTKFKIYQSLTKDGVGLDVAETEMNNYTCRFCLEEGQLTNPLLCPCKCSGSSKYIHLKCVQEWLTKSINPHQVNNSMVIGWKPLICQLCHKSMPFKIYLDGKRYFTVKIPRPQKPYLVLNPIFREKEDKNKSKIYYLISFSQQRDMVIGRKKDSHILLSEDSSVSRNHSKIIFQEEETKEKDKINGHFYIEDNDSKFGTLVMLKKEILLKKELSGITFQLGGDVIEVHCGGPQSSHQALKEDDFLNVTESDDSEDYEEEGEEEGGGQMVENNQEGVKGIENNGEPLKR